MPDQIIDGHHNRLAALADDIRKLETGIRRSADQIAEDIVAAGQRLIEAKALLPHGAWTDWLHQHCNISERTARRYMKIARSDLKTATLADLGMTAALANLSREAWCERAYEAYRKAVRLMAADDCAALDVLATEIADPLDRLDFWRRIQDADRTNPFGLIGVIAARAASLPPVPDR
jgi:Protein of unknown function (DUF3102)